MTATVGLGVGATTTIYAVVDGVLLRPLSYHDPSRLVTVGSISSGPTAVDPETGLYDLGPVDVMEYRELRDRARSFDALAATLPIQVLVSTEHGSEEYVAGARATPNYFTALGVAPALGRTFLSEDAVLVDPSDPAAQSVVLLTHGYWQRRYGGDPNVVGRALEPAGRASQLAGSTIVGVLPEGFMPPEPFHAAGEPPEIYAPIPEIPGVSTTAGGGVRVVALGGLRLVGRLSVGTTIEEATDEVRRLGEEQPSATLTLSSTGLAGGGRGGLALNELHAQTVGSTGGTLWIFLGAAGLLLVLTALNAASLLLARGMDRLQELSVRMALGAGRGRLARLLLVETGVLVVLGAVLGVAAAYAGVDAGDE